MIVLGTKLKKYFQFCKDSVVSKIQLVQVKLISTKFDEVNGYISLGIQLSNCSTFVFLCAGKFLFLFSYMQGIFFKTEVPRACLEKFVGFTFGLEFEKFLLLPGLDHFDVQLSF